MTAKTLPGPNVSRIGILEGRSTLGHRYGIDLAQAGVDFFGDGPGALALEAPVVATTRGTIADTHAGCRFALSSAVNSATRSLIR